MAVNVADVLVKIKADGVQATRAELLALTGALKQASSGLEGTGKGATTVNTTVQSLIYSFNGLAASSVGVSQSFGTLAVSLLEGFGVSGTVTAGLLIGVTVLARAWEAFGNKADEAGEKLKKALKALRDARTEAENPKGVQLGHDIAEIDRQVAALETRITNIRTSQRDEFFRATGKKAGPGDLPETDDIKKLRTEIAGLVRDRAFAAGQQIVEAQHAADVEVATLAKVLEAHVATNAERQQAVAKLRELRAALSGTADATRRGELADQIKALSEALKTSTKDADVAAAAWQKALSKLTPGGVGVTLSDPASLLGLSASAKATADQITAFVKEHPPQIKRIELAPRALADALEGYRKEAADAGLTLGQDLASGLVSAVSAGFAALGRGDGIGGALKAFGGSLLAGLGSAIKAFGEKALMASTLMKAFLAAMSHLNPVAGAVAAIGLIALGSMIEGAASSSFGGGGGGGGGIGYRGVAVRGSTDNTIRYTIGSGAGGGTAAGTPSAARNPVNVQLVAFGTLTPTQKREFANLVNDAERSGLLTTTGRRV